MAHGGAPELQPRRPAVRRGVAQSGVRGGGLSFYGSYKGFLRGRSTVRVREGGARRAVAMEAGGGVRRARRRASARGGQRSAFIGARGGSTVTPLELRREVVAGSRVYGDAGSTVPQRRDILGRGQGCLLGVRASRERAAASGRRGAAHGPRHGGGGGGSRAARRRGGAAPSRARRGVGRLEL
jgi:hypothetical protein